MVAKAEIYDVITRVDHVVFLPDCGICYFFHFHKLDYEENVLKIL